MARLRVERSPAYELQGETFELDSMPFSIGRISICSLRLNDTGASRRHAEIRDAPDGLWILDLGSVNGTIVNGARVEKAWLRDGDRIEIGQTTFVFEDAAGKPDELPVIPTPPSVADPELERPALPPPLPDIAAPVPAGEPRARSSRWMPWLLAGCLTILMIPILAGVGWWWTSRSHDGFPSFRDDGPGGAAPERELVLLDLGIPPAPPLAVTKGRELGSAKISSRNGGTIEAGDGLVVRVPPGALPDDRTITISEATVPEPDETVAFAGGGEAKLSVLEAWDIDAGSAGDLFPGEIELTARCEKGQVPLWAAISVDGTHWTRVPADIDGELVRFRTRHFCPVTIIGLSQAAVLVLPIAAVAYIVYDRADELPEYYHPHAPFVSLDVNPQGFQILWSRSLPGVDKATGFRDEKRYMVELERVAKEYSAIGGGGTTGAASMTSEVNALKKQYLMPDKVKEVEEALVYAQSYLKARKIAAPSLSLPVYVVPTLGSNAGMIHNPWAGRRYMLVGADAGKDVIWTVALHELFHHYQTGYVWLDRTGHLPFLEASALLMEREAIATYKAEGKPFNAGEGLAIAQMLVYRNGLDGPAEWKEEYVRGHGYGLTWFLEYLRDEKYVGLTKKNVASDFHSALLGQWGGRWTGALRKGFVWAAGGERELASGFMEFAQNYVLEGKVDGCGSQTPYGSAYNACPFQDSPYSAHLASYGLPASRIDLAKTPVVTLGDDAIRPWSIQFYEISAEGAAKSVAVVRAPRTWFPKTGPGRGLFLRESADESKVEGIAGGDMASPSHPDMVATLPIEPPSYAYVVDTGQTGSGWISDNPAMTIFLLGPPDNVKSEIAGKKQRISWTPPAVAATEGLVQAVRLYASGSAMPERTLKISETSVELDLEGSARAIELTSAVEVGRDEDDEPVYLESPRTDPVGGADAGSYEMCIDISAETPKLGSECAAMNHHWFFDRVQVCFSVKVASNGKLQFKHQWTEPGIGSRTNVEHWISGSGTFVGNRLDVKGRFRTIVEWEQNEHELKKDDGGTFEAHGKYSHGIWFGEKLTGTFSSTIDDDYCASSENGECQERKHETTSCSGKIPAILSSVESFSRK